MFSGLLGSVPLFWKVPVLLCFVILIMFVMILFAGYKVRLPLFLGEIGPANVAPPANNLALEQQIQDLKSMIVHIKSQNVAVDGNPDNCLQYDTKSLPVSRKSSGIEELVPLGYDCHEKNHKDEKIQKISCETPIKKLKKDLILTPVKGRVVSQPDIFHKQPVFTDEDASSENQILDLTRKRSDSFPKSPVKNLVVKGCESPKSTKFEWVSTESSELGTEERTISEEIVIDEVKQSEFLNKVEDLFKPDEV